MGEDIVADVKRTVQTLKESAEQGDMRPALQAINTEIMTKQGKDPSYEPQFMSQLNDELQKQGLLPKVLIEYAKEAFPAFRHQQTFTTLQGRANDPTAYIVYRQDLQNVMFPKPGDWCSEHQRMEGGTPMYNLPGTIVAAMNSMVVQNGIRPLAISGQMPAPPVDRMFISNIAKNFDQINDGSPWRRQIFRDTINVTDLENWFKTQNKNGSVSR
jgi:hypothetical protein